jgi:uncharacterized protein RhaS with RHS repeats
MMIITYRWISPDSAGAVDGLNLYVYVDNNPLKYIDPTGHGVDTIIFDNFLDRINRDKTSELNIWIGDGHLVLKCWIVGGW